MPRFLPGKPSVSPLNEEKMKKHILLVDDNKEELHAFMQALNQTGLSYKCTYANSYTHALKMLEYLVPDFIFLDIHITESSWHDCLQQVAANPKLQHVPIVICSPALNDRMVKEALSLGASYCLPKPVSSRDMQVILEDNPFVVDEQGHLLPGKP